MLPLQISACNLTLLPEADADIRERAAALQGYYGRILGCRVTIGLSARRHGCGALHHVQIDLTVPGGALIIRRRPHEDLRTAVQIAFNAARRRLQVYNRRQRGAVRLREPKALGRVTEYYPLGGYGFIETEDGRTVYFDRHSVRDDGFDRLDVGLAVRLAEQQGPQGLRARAVVPLSAAPPIEVPGDPP